jgi:hypothetical protein
LVPVISPPFEADPPLVVDANAELALSIALQSFEAVARQCRQILQGDRRLDPVQLETRGDTNCELRYA